MGQYTKKHKQSAPRLWGKQARTMTVRQNRRDTIYKMKLKRNSGKCPCFVCGKHVTLQDATLEHVVERSKGGTDDMSNLDISHGKCNKERSKK